jgi:toxin CptA
VLHLRLRKSWLLTALLTTAHVAVMAILFVVSAGLWIKAAAIAAVGSSLVYQVRRSAWRMGPSSVAALRIGNDDVLTIETRAGQTLTCEVLPTTFVSPIVTVLNLRALPERRRVDAVIFCDCVDTEDFRKLRVWLRWKAHDVQLGEQAEGSKTDDA